MPTFVVLEVTDGGALQPILGPTRCGLAKLVARAESLPLLMNAIEDHAFRTGRVQGDAVTFEPKPVTADGPTPYLVTSEQEGE